MKTNMCKGTEKCKDCIKKFCLSPELFDLNVKVSYVVTYLHFSGIYHTII